jgi:site-specific recombinase XerD
MDLRTIQEWLGHRSIEMTVRYTRISQSRFNADARRSLTIVLPDVIDVVV